MCGVSLLAWPLPSNQMQTSPEAVKDWIAPGIAISSGQAGMLDKWPAWLNNLYFQLSMGTKAPGWDFGALGWSAVGCCVIASSSARFVF